MEETMEVGDIMMYEVSDRKLEVSDRKQNWKFNLR